MEAVKTEKYRGTIIIDREFLKDLCMDIPSSDPPRKYLDLLPVLAQNGFHVVIPEITAFQTVDILPSGADYGSVFTNRNEYWNDTLKPFIKGVIKGEYSGVEVLQKTGPERVDKACRDIQAGYDRYKSRIPELEKAFRGNGPSPKERAEQKATGELRADFKKLLDAREPETYWGEEAIFSVIDRLHDEGHKGKIFLFTDSHKLRIKIKGSEKYNDVHDVTNNVLMNALVLSGLHKEFGVAECMSPEQLEAEKTKFFETVGHKIIHQNHNMTPKSYIEYVEAKAITGELRDIARDMKAGKHMIVPEVPVEADEKAHLAQVAAGRASRFGRFADIRKKATEIGQGGGAARG